MKKKEERSAAQQLSEPLSDEDLSHIIELSRLTRTHAIRLTSRLLSCDYFKSIASKAELDPLRLEEFLEQVGEELFVFALRSRRTLLKWPDIRSILAKEHFRESVERSKARSHKAKVLNWARAELAKAPGRSKGWLAQKYKDLNPGAAPTVQTVRRYLTDLQVPLTDGSEDHD